MREVSRGAALDVSGAHGMSEHKLVAIYTKTSVRSLAGERSAMRRQFEHRARLVVYLENADVQRMTARAVQDGMVLMDWVRETLLGELDELPTRGSGADIGSAKRKGSVAVRVRKEADVPAEPDAGAGHHVHASEGPSCGHAAEPGFGGRKCRKWGCVNYVFAR